MTLLCSLLAAVFSTLAWYINGTKKNLCLSALVWMYWGASLMWLVDAVHGYMEEGAQYFRPEPLDLLNDLFLGLCVVTLGLIIWIVILLIKDPRGVVKSALLHKKK